MHKIDSRQFGKGIFCVASQPKREKVVYLMSCFLSESWKTWQAKIFGIFPKEHVDFQEKKVCDAAASDSSLACHWRKQQESHK